MDSAKLARPRAATSAVLPSSWASAHRPQNPKKRGLVTRPEASQPIQTTASAAQGRLKVNRAQLFSVGLTSWVSVRAKAFRAVCRVPAASASRIHMTSSLG